MTSHAPRPHVVAFADQLLAAASRGATSVELAGLITGWIQRRRLGVNALVVLPLVDADLEELAFHLASQREAPAAEDVRSGVAVPPELPSHVVPALALHYISLARPSDAHRVWANLSLARAAGDPQLTLARANDVVAAIGFLVRHAAARVGQ